MGNYSLYMSCLIIVTIALSAMVIFFHRKRSIRSDNSYPNITRQSFSAPQLPRRDTYTTIAEAIENVHPGGTVYVAPGSNYVPNHTSMVVLTDNINIVGTGYRRMSTANISAKEKVEPSLSLKKKSNERLTRKVDG